MPAATILSQAALNSAQVFGSSVMPALSSTPLFAHSQLMRWMFIGAATQVPFGFITGSSSGATTLSQPSWPGELVDVGGDAGLVPLGDLGALELDGGRRVAGDHVGAKLGKRVGGVTGDRGLLPHAAGGGEHLAELGDRPRHRSRSPTDAACWSSARPMQCASGMPGRSGRNRPLQQISLIFPPCGRVAAAPSLDRFARPLRFFRLIVLGL